MWTLFNFDVISFGDLFDLFFSEDSSIYYVVLYRAWRQYQQQYIGFVADIGVKPDTLPWSWCYTSKRIEEIAKVNDIKVKKRRNILCKRWKASLTKASEDLEVCSNEWSGIILIYPISLHYSTLLYSTLVYSTLHYSTLHYTTLHYSTQCFYLLWLFILHYFFFVLCPLFRWNNFDPNVHLLQ